MRLSDITKLVIGDIVLESDPMFGDELTAYTDGGNYAIVLLDSIDQIDKSQNEVDIQIFCYNNYRSEFSLHSVIHNVPESSMKRVFIEQFNAYNEYDS